MRVLFLVLIIEFAFQACNSDTFISPDQSEIYFQGRIGQIDSGYYEFYWPGTSVTLKTCATDVKVVLSDDKGQSYYNVIIDGIVDTIIKPTKERKSYQLARNLSDGVHSIELFRRTEYTTGTTQFYGFDVEQGARTVPIEIPEMQMVFIGNSITTGYANEDTLGLDRPTGTFTNNYNAYGAVSARYLNADYQCIARGGIGFMASWYPVIMPEIYYLTNPNDKNIKWIPRPFQKKIIVINLGQNDSWILADPNLDAYKSWFGDSDISTSDIIAEYQEFVRSIRNFYPNAHIICALGSMDAVRDDSPWFSLIHKAVEDLNDSNISTLKFPFLAKKKHPTVADHQIMADMLVRHIEDNVILK